MTGGVAALLLRWPASRSRSGAILRGAARFERGAPHGDVWWCDGGPTDLDTLGPNREPTLPDGTIRDTGTPTRTAA